MDGGRVLSPGCRLEGGGGFLEVGGGGGVVWSLFSLSQRFFIMSTEGWYYMQPCKCKTEGSFQIHFQIARSPTPYR